MDVQPVEAGAARHVVRDVAADARRRHDDAVARLGRRHEGVEIGDGAGRHADFRVARAEDLGREFGGDDLDPLDASSPISYLSPG